MAKRNASSSAGSRPKSSGSQGKPNILVIWGRRHRHYEPELLQQRSDGLPHAQH
jgi:hypothetical protein